MAVETKPFDVERDLVTATLKNRRNNLLKYYQVSIILNLILKISVLIFDNIMLNLRYL